MNIKKISAKLSIATALVFSLGLIGCANNDGTNPPPTGIPNQNQNLNQDPNLNRNRNGNNNQLRNPMGDDNGALQNQGRGE